MLDQVGLVTDFASSKPKQCSGRIRLAVNRNSAGSVDTASWRREIGKELI
jgi:hypothetical protein